MQFDIQHSVYGYAKLYMRSYATALLSSRFNASIIASSRMHLRDDESSFDHSPIWFRDESMQLFTRNVCRAEVRRCHAICMRDLQIIISTVDLDTRATSEKIRDLCSWNITLDALWAAKHSSTKQCQTTWFVNIAFRLRTIANADVNLTFLDRATLLRILNDPCWCWSSWYAGIH